MQTRAMMQKRLGNILQTEISEIVSLTEISNQETTIGQIRTVTTKQDMLWRDSLHGSSVDSTELESDTRD